MTSHSRVWTRARGFTMVELIVVMILIGILGAVGVSRFFDRETFDAAAFAEQSRATLRYAQKAAIAQNRPVFVLLDGTSIRLCFNNANPCTAGNEVLMPAVGPVITPSPYTGAVNHFYFDALGRPFDASNDTALPDLTLTVTGGASAPLINVAQETGYVF